MDERGFDDAPVREPEDVDGRLGEDTEKGNVDVAVVEGVAVVVVDSK